MRLDAFYSLLFLVVGGVAEWSNAAVLKTVVGVSPPRVRISAPPNIALEASHSWLSAPVSKTGMVVRPSEVRTLPPPNRFSDRRR